MGNMVESVSPRHALKFFAGYPNQGIQQTALKPEGFAKGGALGAETTEICGVIRIANNRRGALPVRSGEHTAADAAIGTCRTCGFKSWIECCHAVPRMTQTSVLRRDDRTACRTRSPQSPRTRHI